MEKQKKPRKKASKAKLVLIIGIIIILIPCLIFGGILLSAALQTGKPVLGERFANDLDPAITDQDSSALIADIKSISNVENCTINLTSAQYRINVDVVDGATDEQVSDIADQVYKKVENKLPISKYFTADGSKKMYDLSINVYNFIDSENENMIYYIITKNSVMEGPGKQCVSVAVDEELASELRGENQSSIEPEVDEASEVQN